MKRIAFVVLAACAAFSVEAAKKELSPRDAARLAFEKPYLDLFVGRTVEVEKKEVRSKSEEGRSEGERAWTFALPIDRTERLRFAKVTLDGATFVKGTLAYFGLPEQELTAAEFRELRATFPMLGTTGGKGEPARLFAPTSKPLAYPVPQRVQRSLRVDVLGDLYGNFLAAVAGRLKVKAGDVAYRVTYFDKDGTPHELGTVVNAKKRNLLDKDALLVRLGELSGRVSDRERIDYFLEGRLAFEPVSVTPNDKNKKGQR